MSAYFPNVRAATISQSNGLIEIARHQAANLKDFGVIGCYNTTNYAGIVRSAADGKFYIFDKLTTSPFVSDALVVVNTAPAAVVMGGLTAVSITTAAVPFIIQNGALAPIIAFDPTTLMVTTSRAINCPNILRSVTVFTTNTTLTVNNGICQFDCSAGPITATLPSVMVASGIQLYFIKIDASPNALTILPYGTDAVGESDTIILTDQWTHTTLICMGAIGWFTI